MIPYENEILSIQQELRQINRKLDQIIAGPVFTSTITRIGTLDEKVAENLRSLNNMILQVKGVVTQIRAARNIRSDWDGKEVKGKVSIDILEIE